MKKKYVRMMYAGFFLFDESTPHLHFEYIAEQAGDHITSAGFFDIGDDGKAVCYGKSIGLRVESAEGDTEDLQRFLGQNVSAQAAPYPNQE